jgi:hypothetical protein
METFLKKELIDAKYNFSIFKDHITIIENFLSKEEVKEILEIINNTPNEDWSIEYTKSLSKFCLDKFGRDDVENLVAEGKFEITQGWHDKNLDIKNLNLVKKIHLRLSMLITKADKTLELAGFSTLQRMQPGVELKSHTDQHTDPSIRYAAILYLNDDYKDGALFFKNKKDSDLKPKPGTLLIFPGNEEYEHGVKHVGEGPIRYVIVGFIKVRNFYENNKY